MSPKPRPDCEGWWWVKSPCRFSKTGVKWRCLESTMGDWEVEPDSYQSILQVLNGCWLRADKINNGIMDGSEWFPAAPPSWPEGGAA